MLEEWRDIPGFEGHYKVSNRGQVKTIGGIRKDKIGRNYTVKERIKTIYWPSNGYGQVSLGRTGRYNVHVLVAMAFLGHKPNGHKVVVDHINNNPSDNRLENLQLITQSDNVFRGVDKTKTSSEFKGVYYDKRRDNFSVQKRIDGKLVYLGSYKDKKEANQVYKNFIGIKNIMI